MSKRLLILKCSSRKRGDPGLLPVVERYDGPLWQVLRAYLRERASMNQQALWDDDHAGQLVVYGLSAEYGIIAAERPIPLYDRTMTEERAEQLRPEVLQTFGDLLRQDYTHLCLGLSKRYLRALEGWEELVPSGTQVTLTDGPVGTKLGQLRAWLREENWVSPVTSASRLVAPAHPRGRAIIRGTEVVMTREEVFEHARKALANGVDGANRFRDWYVLVDNQPLSPKWLVSILTGLPTTAFEASHARHVLLALGVNVERVTGERGSEGVRGSAGERDAEVG